LLEGFDFLSDLITTASLQPDEISIMFHVEEEKKPKSPSCNHKEEEAVSSEIEKVICFHKKKPLCVLGQERNGRSLIKEKLKEVI
jgi:hypothetical protein